MNSATTIGLRLQMMSLMSQRPDLVEHCAKELLAIEPEDQQGWFYLVSSYSRTRNLPLLLDSCSTALSLFPNEQWPYESLGDYYFHHCQAECYYYALQVYLHTLKISNPLNHAVIRQIAEIYLINWEPQKAVIWLEEAFRIKPERAEYCSRLALAHLRCRNPKAALSLVKQALAMDPGEKNNMNNCATVFLYSGELEQAEELCRIPMIEHPDYLYFQRQLRKCLHEIDDRANRLKKDLRYTPLYLRQSGTQQHFDEEARIIKITPDLAKLGHQPILTPWELFPEWRLPNKPEEIIYTTQREGLGDHFLCHWG